MKEVPDSDTGLQRSVEYYFGLYDEYKNVIRFLNDWENGKFTVTLSEYRKLPAVVIEARNVYRKYVKEYGNK